MSPTLQGPDGLGGGEGAGDGEGVGDGAGGDGEGEGGEGEGGTPDVQSSSFGFGQHIQPGVADGHVDPSGQQPFPAQPTPSDGHVTGSPTLQVADEFPRSF